ncbi:hypothetical protein J8L88_10230 [Aquimarina sp. MMG015]|uniref:hypothetical protein n=1 Tax=Aquimarina TaxID=290174 RepID=UPI00041486F4|nr:MULTISPECIES: hypothetical protein [Aquimarina]AXT57833.1 hypothetical protein D1815_19505 [Aquimarina sp. AD1]MBQ4803225.1 hypothetical protein [Aquimarina sp. MMG015]RKN35007.1 hypothetical protein D7035_03735 [Aquimarina sp. AD1]
MKKFLVLGILFILPIVMYLFFASAVDNFSKLPVLKESIGNLDDFESLTGEQITLEDKITILGFFGEDIQDKKGNVFNLNQKIYNKNREFRDFQLVMALPYGSENAVKDLLEELDDITDVSGWKFVFGTPESVQRLFKGLQTPYKLNQKNASNFVFIIDKNVNLRGREENQEKNELEVYGYDTSSVADLNNVMVDDVKVILAEYRLALKKYKADRKEK